MSAVSSRFLSAVTAALCALSAAHAQSDYTFTIDGTPVEPALLLGQEKPAAGDLAQLGGWLLTLPEPGVYQLERGDDALIWRDGDTERTVALELRWWHIPGEEEPAPGAGLDDDQVAALWGVSVRGWHEGLAAFLKRLPPDTALAVWWSRLGDEPPPPIPQHITRLQFDGNMEGEDLAVIAGLDELEYLAVGANGAAFAGEWMPPQARVVELRRVQLRAFEHMPRASALRRVTLEGVAGARTVEFVRQAPALQELKILWSDTESVAAIAGHPALQRLAIAGCPVHIVPEEAAPQLQEATFLSADLSPMKLGAFERLHPGADLTTGWKRALVASAEGCDRIRVRSGGTCHRDRSAEETLAEVAGAEAVQRMLDMIEIDDHASGVSCRCCGSPTIELYRGQELALSIGFHHGQLLRWLDGAWPGDGILALQSAEALVEWLAAEGVEGPREEFQQAQSRDDAMGRRFMRYTSIMPADVQRRLREAQSEEEAAVALGSIDDPVEQGAFALRMLGCHYDSWRNLDPFIGLLTEQVLPEVAAEDLAAAVTREADEAIAVGAARWLFSNGAWDGMPEESLRRMLPAAGRAGVTHPDEIARRQSITALSRIEAPEAVAVLRDLLHERIRQVRPAPELLEEAAISKVFRSSDEEIEAPADDAVAAAIALSRHADTKSLPRILELMEMAEGEDRKHLEQAARALGWEG